MELTATFVESGRAVWKQPYIEAALLAMSGDKCAYCETLVVDESQYLEIEHFRPKDAFPDLVVQWSNLLPSCKRCNVRKGSYNVDVEGMIIDPSTETPSSHFRISNYRLRAKTELGQNTLDILYLNDSARLVSARFELGERIAQALEVTRDLVQGYLDGPNIRRRNRIVGALEALLAEAQPSSAFSATAATCLVFNPDYLWIKWQFEQLELWTPEMSVRHATAESIALS